MPQLGKYVKGKVMRKEARRTMMRIRNQDQTLEEMQKEQDMMKLRRENLKTQMVEEQRLSHLNRMKILTQWRKWLRLSKTETLKK